MKMKQKKNTFKILMQELKLTIKETYLYDLTRVKCHKTKSAAN